jgi:hypothetical protein
VSRQWECSRRTVRKPHCVQYWKTQRRQSYACRTDQMGMHGRYPARDGSQIFLQPRQLYHHHRFPAQNPHPARSAEQCFGRGGLASDQDFVLALTVRASSYPYAPDLVATAVAMSPLLRWAAGAACLKNLSFGGKGGHSADDFIFRKKPIEHKQGLPATPPTYSYRISAEKIGFGTPRRHSIISKL